MAEAEAFIRDGTDRDGAVILADRSRKLILLRRSLVMAIVFGVLLVPATCSHAAGPHSIYVDPRESESSEHQHHDHETPAHQTASHDAAPNHAASGEHGQAAGGGTTMSDLPSAMRMTIASSTMFLTIPQVMAIPAVQSPESPRAGQALTGAPVRVDVPPPRTGMLVAFQA